MDGRTDGQTDDGKDVRSILLSRVKIKLKTALIFKGAIKILGTIVRSRDGWQTEGQNFLGLVIISYNK